METRVIIEKVYRDNDKSKRKGEVVDWSEAMSRFNLTTEELKEKINKGLPIEMENVTYFVDESLTY